MQAKDENQECLLVNGSDKVLEAIIKNIPFKVVGLEHVKLEQQRSFSDKLKINLDLLCEGLSISPGIKSLSFKECIFNRQPIEAAQCLGRLVQTHPTLESIRLGHTLYSDGLEYFFEGLKHNSTLRSIDATFIDLNEAAALALKEALRFNTTLADLNLTGVKFGSFKSLKYIVQAIGFNNSLKTLRLSKIENRDVDYEEAVDEEPARKKQKTGYTSSKRSNDDLDEENSLDGIDPLYIEHKLRDALIRNTTLTKLSLTFSEIFPIYGEVLRVNTTLTSLEFYQSDRVSDDSVHEISEALKVNTSLRSLVLEECNEFATEWSHDSFEVLTVNSTLTELGLGSAEISGEASQRLFTALARNTTLLSLDLSNGVFDSQMPLQLRDYLKENTTLTKLDFAGGDFHYGHVVLDSLKLNSTLQSLDLGFTNMNAESYMELSSSLRQNNSLKSLRLSNCNIRGDGARHLAEGLQGNSSLESLDLSDNYLGITGARDICAALQSHPKLTRLVYTTYTSDEHEYFGRLLMATTTLESLRLEGVLHTLAMKHLCDGLKFNTTLQSLQLFQNDDGTNQIEESRKLLIEALTINQSVTSYEGSHVRLVDGIEPLLAKNLKLRRDRLDNVLVLSHNIVRTHKHGHVQFPLEVWTHVVSYLRYPSIKFNFATMLQTVANRYK